MKNILLALALVGLTQYSANAWPRYYKGNCHCICTNQTTTHKTALHKARHTKSTTNGQAFMMTNSGKYVPYTNYAVYGRVHMSNRFVCTTRKELVPDPFAGIMSPVVTPETVTTCEDKLYLTKDNRPLATPAVYKTSVTNKVNKNSLTQPCAYKSHGIRVSYCLQ